jgi:nicotinamidase-related amidase
MSSSSSHMPPTMTAHQTSSAKKVQTYQALVLIGLHEQLLNKDKPTAVNLSSGFLDKITRLIPKFRDRAGYIIWIPTEISETERLPKTPKDVDKFIGVLRNKDQANWTAEMKTPELHPQAQSVLNKDLDTTMAAPYWTSDTVQSFTDRMYASVITKIFICGCITDSSIYLLMLEAARKGWDVVIIEDCLGFYDKDKKRHKLTLKHMMEKLFVEGLTSKEMDEDLDRAVEMEGVMTEGELGNMLDTLLGSPAGKGKEPGKQIKTEQVEETIETKETKEKEYEMSQDTGVTVDEKLEASKNAAEESQHPAEDHALIKAPATLHAAEDQPNIIQES